MNLGIKSKLILYIVFPLIGLFIFMYILMSGSFSSYTDDTIHNISLKVAENYSAMINEKISTNIELLNTSKVYFENTTIKNSTLSTSQKKVLKDMMVNKHDFSSVWFVFENESGEEILYKYTRTENEIKFDNKVLGIDNFYKDVFRNMKNSPEETILLSHNKYNLNEENKLIFSLVKPIYKNNEITGITGGDFNIKKTIQKIEIDNKKEDITLLLAYNNELYTIKSSIFLEPGSKLERTIQQSINQINNTFFYTNETDNSENIISIIPLRFKSKSANLALVVLFSTDYYKAQLNQFKVKFFGLSLFTILLLAFIIHIISKYYLKRVKETSSVLNAMATGRVSEIIDLNTSSGDEFAAINNSINTINYNLNKTASFIEEITKGNFSFEYRPLTDEDRIANSLLDMKTSLEQAQELDLKRKEIEQRQSWATIGAAKFSEIIREHSDNLEELAYAIISDLVNYIDANQGGLFIINEDSDDKYIELLASYAYSRRKMLTKKIPWGVGLVGRCILEKETIFMSKIPEKYLSITSGLGEENPATLLLVPLIFHEEVFGVVELASFKGIEQYKIDLTEQISESIASAIQMVKINVRTAELLRETKIKSEQAASQEEEIRQNIEEMQASTEELNLNLEDISNTFNAVYSVANIAQFDLNGRVTDISDNFLKLLRKDKKDIIGKVQGSFSSEAQNQESFNKFWRELKRGKQMEYEQVIDIEGDLVRIYSVYVPIKNAEGKVYKVVSFAMQQ